VGQHSVEQRGIEAAGQRVNGVTLWHVSIVLDEGLVRDDDVTFGSLERGVARAVRGRSAVNESRNLLEEQWLAVLQRCGYRSRT
jgi:hypothetical protein